MDADKNDLDLKMYCAKAMTGLYRFGEIYQFIVDSTIKSSIPVSRGFHFYLFIYLFIYLFLFLNSEHTHTPMLQYRITQHFYKVISSFYNHISWEAVSILFFLFFISFIAQFRLHSSSIKSGYR